MTTRSSNPLRLERMPQIALKLGLRIFKGGQKYRLLPEEKTLPLPPVRVHPDVRALQSISVGKGPLFFKQYTVDFLNSQLSAEEIVARIQANPDRYSPQSLAHYEKTRGAKGVMHLGDEYLIHLTGPWNGPVRAVNVTPLSHTFATLEGHMEAGKILFEIQPGPKTLKFEITSWARSRDEGVDLAYDKFKLAQLVQAEMWTSYLENMIRDARAKKIGPVRISTQRIPQEKIPAELLRE